MAQMMLFALGITELRDIFGAAPELADRLRAAACARLPPLTRKQPGRGSLLGRIGPILKRPIEPTAPIPDRPAEFDVENLLAARTVAPGRLAYAWQITLGWLADLSWGQIELELDERGLTQVEFDLARAGLPARLGLERLLQGNPQVPLQTPPGQRFGYAKHAHVEQTRSALAEIEAEVPEQSRPLVARLLEFLGRFAAWAELAEQAGRPAPDLIVVWPQARG
mgnify:CR=1 FL=1